MNHFNTPALVLEIRHIIEDCRKLEEDNDLPDSGFALVSLDFAEANLDKLWVGNPPKEFLDRYVQILENRFRRLTDEDAGEYGSGRDALGNVLSRLEQISCSLAA